MFKIGQRLVLVLLAALGSTASADDTGEKQTARLHRDAVGIPIIFSSEDWGVALGAAGVVKGIIQPQMTLFGMAIGSSNKSRLGFLGLYNISPPGFDRWLVDVSAYDATQTDTRFFLSGNPAFAMEQAGSNDSSLENFIRDGVRDRRYHVDLKYTVPIGAGKNGALAALVKKYQGYENNIDTWNPLTSGITTLELRPFFFSQRLDSRQPDSDTEDSIGVRVKLEYDNRNSVTLPTQGSKTSFTYIWDWGSRLRPSWSTVEFQYSKFFNLGSNSLMKQQVLAFNGWIADTPTWNQTEVVNGQTVFRRPPTFMGINLGGLGQAARVQFASLLWSFCRVVQYGIPDSASLATAGNVTHHRRHL